MSSSFARLDTDFPMAWEDVDTLRFGFDQARVRIRQPSAGQQRFVASLRRGIDTNRVVVEAKRAGVTPREAHALIAELSPVLRSDDPAPPALAGKRKLRTLLCDDGREVCGLREALLATKLCTFEGGIRRGHGAPNRNDEDPTDLVILIERFLEPLERSQRWLIAEQPQLLLRFSDRSILVGPLIGAEGNPCHTCVTLSLLEADAALPVLAAQLYGKAPASETEAGAHMAAAWAAVLIRGWRAHDPEVHTTQVEIPVCDGAVAGAVRFLRVAPHPECACNSLNLQSRPP